MPPLEIRYPCIGTVSMRLGSDDFLYQEIFFVSVPRISMLVMMLYVVLTDGLDNCYEALAEERRGDEAIARMQAWAYTTIACHIFGLMLAAWITFWASRGSIMDTEKRDPANALIGIQVFGIIPESILAFCGIVYSWNISSDNWRYTKAYKTQCFHGTSIEIIRACSTWHLVCTVLGFIWITCFVRRCNKFGDPWSACCIRFGGVLNYCGFGLDHADALESIATQLVKYTQDIDLVHTDVIAGLMLVWRKHKLIRGREVLAKERREAKEQMMAQAQNEASKICHSEPGVDGALNEIAWASWYALGIYGWPLHVFKRAEPWCLLPAPYYMCEGSPCVAAALMGKYGAMSNDYLDDYFMSNGACLRLALRDLKRGDFGTYMQRVPMGDPSFKPGKYEVAPQLSLQDAHMRKKANRNTIFDDVGKLKNTVQNYFSLSPSKDSSKNLYSDSNSGDGGGGGGGGAPLSGDGMAEDGVSEEKSEYASGRKDSSTVYAPSTPTKANVVRDPEGVQQESRSAKDTNISGTRRGVESEPKSEGTIDSEDDETWDRGMEEFNHPYVVWCNWAHSLEAQPYAVCVDPVAKAVVLTIRGSMSSDDAITDCFVDEERLPYWAGGGTGHGAMVRSAILILKELGEMADHEHVTRFDSFRRVSRQSSGTNDRSNNLKPKLDKRSSSISGKSWPKSDSEAEADEEEEEEEEGDVGVLASLLIHGRKPTKPHLDLSCTGRCSCGVFLTTCKLGKRRVCKACRSVDDHVNWAACKKFNLVVTGHSLGAGICAIICMLLRPRYGDRLKGYPISPPGGLLSKDCVESTDEYMTSVLFGDDMVPRLSIRTMERLRDEVISALITNKQSKLSILLEGIFDTAYKTPRSLALANETGDKRGLWGCWARWGLCSSCELHHPHPDTDNCVDDPSVAMVDMEEGADDGTALTWPKAGAFQWPREEQASCARALKLLKVMTSNEREYSEEMWPPGRILHIERQRTLPVSCCSTLMHPCHSVTPEYSCRWAKRDDFQRIRIVLPHMLMDHFPNHIADRVHDYLAGAGADKHRHGGQVPIPQSAKTYRSTTDDTVGGGMAAAGTPRGDELRSRGLSNSGRVSLVLEDPVSPSGVKRRPIGKAARKKPRGQSALPSADGDGGGFGVGAGERSTFESPTPQKHGASSSEETGQADRAASPPPQV